MIRNPGKKKLKGADVRETPRALYNELNSEFGFTLDAAACHDNALCPRYYTETAFCLRGNVVHLEELGGLSGSWSGHRVWINPPFTMLLEFTDKAWLEAPGCPLITMLVPMNRTDQPWWQRNVAPYVKHPGFNVRWFPERHRFTVDGGKPILNSKGKVGSPSFACGLLIWGA